MIDIFSPPSMLDEVLFDITHHRLPGPVSMHSHSCVEIVVVVSGSAVQEVGGIRRKVYGGVTTIINPGCAHMFDEVHDLELYNVSCSANLFEQFGGGMIFLKGRDERFSSRHPFSLFLLPGLVFCDIRHLLELMFEKYAEDESPKRQPLLRSLFSFFLVLLIQSYRPEVNRGRRASPLHASSGHPADTGSLMISRVPPAMNHTVEITPVMTGTIRNTIMKYTFHQVRGHFQKIFQISGIRKVPTKL